MADEKKDILDDIFERVETKAKSKRGMKKLSEYNDVDRAKKELQLKKMRERAVAVNRAKKQVKMDLLKESNPILFEARQLAARQSAPTPEPVIAEKVSEPVIAEKVVKPEPAEVVKREQIKREQIKVLDPKPAKKRSPVRYNLYSADF